MRTAARSFSLDRFLAIGAPILALFIISRGTLWLTGYLGGLIFGDGVVPFYLCHYDCVWYLGIVERGYQTEPGGFPPGSANWAFFPAYPLLVKAVAAALGLSSVAAGMAVSNAAFLAGLYFVYAYYRTAGADNHRAALFPVALLCYSPASVYFLSPYTESLFLLAMAMAFHFGARERWVHAGLAAAVLSGTRLVGIFMVPALILLALARRTPQDLMAAERRSPSLAIGVCLGPLGLVLFMVYLHAHLGDALAFKHVQVAWSRELGNPFLRLARGFVRLDSPEFWYAAVASLGLSLGVYGLWRRRFAEAWVLIVCILVPLATDLRSLPRYVFGLFPFYTLAASCLANSTAAKLIVLCTAGVIAGFYAVAWALNKGFAV